MQNTINNKKCARNGIPRSGRSHRGGIGGRYVARPFRVCPPTGDNSRACTLLACPLLDSRTVQPVAVSQGLACGTRVCKEGGGTVARRRNTQTAALQEALAYRHPEAESPLRPDVGTQSQFKKKKPPVTYRYDSSLSPALSWDGQNPARELGEWLIGLIEKAAALPPPHAFDKPPRISAWRWPDHRHGP